MTGEITLFVYGTLKRGFDAHDRLCAGARDVTSGVTVRGRLYKLPRGYPALVVAEAQVLARATPDPYHDSEVQARTKAPPPHPGSDTVHGQLLTFPDPRDVLSLDAYEGCVPGGNGLYERVLLSAKASRGAVAAWAYTASSVSGRHLPDGVWPGKDGR